MVHAIGRPAPRQKDGFVFGDEAVDLLETARGIVTAVFRRSTTRITASGSLHFWCLAAHQWRGNP